MVSSSVSGSPSSQAPPICPGELGQLSIQSARPSPSVSVSATPQPHAPGAVFAASPGHSSFAFATKPEGCVQLTCDTAGSPAPSPSVSAYHVVGCSTVMITGMYDEPQPRVLVMVQRSSTGPLPPVCVKVALGVDAFGAKLPVPPLATTHRPVPARGVLPPSPDVVPLAQMVCGPPATATVVCSSEMITGM